MTRPSTPPVAAWLRKGARNSRSCSTVRFWCLRPPAVGASGAPAMRPLHEAASQATDPVWREAEDGGCIHQTQPEVQRQHHPLRLAQLLHRLGRSDGLARLRQHLLIWRWPVVP